MEKYKSDFNKNEFCVKSIEASQTHDWYLHKHYAHTIPSITYAFGLFNKNNEMIGVCSFGHPIAPFLISRAFNGKYQDCFFELNRLCVNDGQPLNVLSFFVSQCLKQLPKPMVIVSYADSSHNHHGYIYQATNWIYTGLSAKFQDYMVKGYENMHHASIMDMVGRSDGKQGHLDKVKLLKEKFGDENVYMLERPRKYRYFYLLGNKKEIKEMKKKLSIRHIAISKGR